jgi:hypothetical protein
MRKPSESDKKPVFKGDVVEYARRNLPISAEFRDTILETALEQLRINRLVWELNQGGSDFDFNLIPGGVYPPDAEEDEVFAWLARNGIIETPIIGKITPPAGRAMETAAGGGKLLNVYEMMVKLGEAKGFDEAIRELVQANSITFNDGSRIWFGIHRPGRFGFVGTPQVGQPMFQDPGEVVRMWTADPIKTLSCIGFKLCHSLRATRFDGAYAARLCALEEYPIVSTYQTCLAISAPYYRRAM